VRELTRSTLALLKVMYCAMKNMFRMPNHERISTIWKICGRIKSEFKEVVTGYKVCVNRAVFPTNSKMKQLITLSVMAAELAEGVECA
jgi:hypothetical protein